jgi:2'-5' RNA ligase
MPRLFIAIDLPQTVKDQISNICFGVQGAKWVTQDQLHLTLRFIGEVEDASYHDMVDALSDVVAPAFSFVIKGVGFFPPRRMPNVLWVGVEPNDSLMKLQQVIENSLATAGIDGDTRKFHPHITVARLKERITEREVIPFLSSNNLFRTDEIPVKEFHLYSSVLRPRGPIHTVEASYALDGFGE